MGMSKKLIYGIKVDRNHEASFCPEPRRWVVARNGDIWVCSSLRRYGWIMTWRANRRTWTGGWRGAIDLKLAKWEMIILIGGLMVKGLMDWKKVK